jgi:hypothetical protein
MLKPNAEANAATLQEQRMALQKEVFLTALAENMGILTIASKKAGVNRVTIQRWRGFDKEFNEAVLEQLAHQRGFVEAKLVERINAGDTRAIMFYLRCKGKHADKVDETWVERVELTGDPSAPLHLAGPVLEEARTAMQDIALAKAVSKLMAIDPGAFKAKG